MPSFNSPRRNALGKHVRPDRHGDHFRVGRDGNIAVRSLGPRVVSRVIEKDLPAVKPHSTNEREAGAIGNAGRVVRIRRHGVAFKDPSEKK